MYPARLPPNTTPRARQNASSSCAARRLVADAPCYTLTGPHTVVFPRRGLTIERLGRYILGNSIDDRASYPEKGRDGPYEPSATLSPGAEWCQLPPAQKVGEIRRGPADCKPSSFKPERVLSFPAGRHQRSAIPP